MVSFENEISKTIVRWIILAFFAGISSIGGWVAKTVFSHETVIQIIKQDLNLIKNDISDIKNSLKERKR